MVVTEYQDCKACSVLLLVNDEETSYAHHFSSQMDNKTSLMPIMIVQQYHPSCREGAEIRSIAENDRTAP